MERSDLRGMTSPEMKGRIRDSTDKMGISPDAIARAMVFAIEQPADVDVGEIIFRPTAQSFLDGDAFPEYLSLRLNDFGDRIHA